MNTYVIAPNVVRINVDQHLSQSFLDLDKRLQWRPLTTNLDSCEEAPYLYFRISLEERHANPTYAGFATGAPFMLTRDVDVNKRAFFLRHWVRKVEETENRDAPITPQPHMSVGAHGNRLLIRVEIDRPLDTKDTFKSVPFATWMFQVVQVDAIVHEMPHVRLAFAIERTVTTEEREYITSNNRSNNISANRPSSGHTISRADSRNRHSHAMANGSSTSSRKATASHPTPITPATPAQRHMQPSPVYAPAMQQSVMYNRSPMFGSTQQVRQPLVPTRPSPGIYQQNNPYSFVSPRHAAAAMQMRQSTPTRPATAIQQPLRSANRLVRQSPNTSVTPSPVVTPTAVHVQYPLPTDNPKANTHPDVRLWEEHDINNPYEPLFITEDTKFDEKVRKTIIIDQGEGEHDCFNSENLFGFLATDDPEVNVTMASGGGDEADIEICVQKRRRFVPEMSDVTDKSGDKMTTVEAVQGKKYSAAVLSATDYNSSLREERMRLKSWLVEDAERAEEESDDDDDDDDASMSD